MAVWLPASSLALFDRNRSNIGALIQHNVTFELADADSVKDGVKDIVRLGPPVPRTVHLREVAQLYPSSDGRLHGSGEGHLFAVIELLARLKRQAPSSSL